MKKSLFNKREDTIQRPFGKVKSTQSLVLSPMIDSDSEDESEDAEEEEIALMLEDEPELPAADVVSSAKKFLSVLMKSHHIASKKIVVDTCGRARPRKVPAMATRAHNLLAYALLRTTCQRCSADRQRARMQEAKAKAKAKEDAEAKVKGKEEGAKQKKKGAGEKGKGKVTSKRKGKDNQESKVDGEDPASLFRLLLTNGDAGENSLLTEVSVW